jgi:hypothetical protein
MQTRASFQPKEREMTMAAIRVVEVIRIVPRVVPLMPERCFVSVERKEVRAPVEFSSLSKKLMSWRSMMRKAFARALQIRRSEQ